MAHDFSFSLFDKTGQRKYLNRAERKRFYQTIQALPIEKRLFCELLYYTGARISEVSNLTPAQIDVEDRTVIYKTLKRRKDYVYRQIPLPDHLIGSLYAYLEYLKYVKKVGVFDSLWWYCTRTASRFIKDSMIAAEIDGTKACSMGLRHSFAVHAVSKAPLSQVQKWMGHASIQTTTIYLNVGGDEERKWAEPMWDDS